MTRKKSAVRRAAERAHALALIKRAATAQPGGVSSQPRSTAAAPAAQPTSQGGGGFLSSLFPSHDQRVAMGTSAMQKFFGNKPATPAAPAAPPTAQTEGFFSSLFPSYDRRVAMGTNAMQKLVSNKPATTAAQPTTTPAAPVVGGGGTLSMDAPNNSFIETANTGTNGRVVATNPEIAPKFSPQAGIVRPVGPVQAFFDGMGSGVYNMASAVPTAFIGGLNFGVAGQAGALASLVPHKGTRDLGRHWLQQSAAGGRDFLESFGQYVGVNNAWGPNGQYVGAQKPQNLENHRNFMRDTYFSKPQDRWIKNIWEGTNFAGDHAAGMVPSVATGAGLVQGASKVPALVRAGTAVKNTIEGSRVLNPTLRALSVGTGLPLHPQALAGGGLTAAIGGSQTAQYFGPLLAQLAAHRLGAPETAQRIGEFQQTWMPAIRTDQALAQIHPDLPSLVDYVGSPQLAMQSRLPASNAILDAVAPAAVDNAQRLQEQASTKNLDQWIKNDLVGTYAQAGLPDLAVHASLSPEDRAYFYNGQTSPLAAGQRGHGALIPPGMETDPAQQQAAAAQQPVEAAPAETAAAGENPAAAGAQQVSGQETAPGIEQQTAPTKEQEAAVTSTMQAATDPNAPPEVKQEAKQTFQDFMQQQIAANPEHKAGAADLMAGGERASSPAAQSFREHLQKVGDDVMDAELNRLYAANPNPTPKEAGGFFAQAQQAWHSLPQEAQVMVGLGGSLGMVGLAMSLFGGGMLPMLLAVLGIGGAMIGAAGGGMFGDDGMRMYGQGMRALGNMAGMNIPEGEQDLSALLSGNVMDAAKSGIGDPAERLQQLEMLTSQPRERMIPLLMALDSKHIRTSADAQRAFDNAVRMRQQLQSAGVNAERAQAVQNTANNVATGATNLIAKPGETLGNWANQAREAVTGYFTPKEKTGHTMGLNFKDIIEDGLAKQAAKAAIEKAARCWAGYEPVPGSKPYTDGSCRPKGSKKTQKEMKEKKSASSVFKLNTKQPEAVVNGAKPSTEASKEVSVKREEPKKETDLRPEEVLPTKS